MAEISLKEFDQFLHRAIRKAPDMHAELLKQLGELVLDKVAEETPEVEGRLKASYQRRPFRGENEWVLNVDGDTVEAGTTVFYARMVEEGHAKPDGKGFVPGRHYFQKGYEKAEQEFDRLADQFFRKLGEEMGFD